MNKQQTRIHKTHTENQRSSNTNLTKNRGELRFQLIKTDIKISNKTYVILMQ
jgi:hypothetical protein